MRGTKRQRAPGVWEIRVYVGKDPVSGQDKQISRTIHGTARAADAAIRDLIDAQAPGRADGLGVTFAQLLERWLKECDRMELSPTTMRTYRSHVSHVLVPRLGRVLVARLTAKHLDDLYGALKDSRRSPKTIRNVHATISSALHQAERWGWVRQNIAELAKPPRVAQRRLALFRLTWSGQSSGRLATRPAPLAPLLMLAALTGIQLGGPTR